ncbi:hypothetical protein [Actinoplanes sp. L3-i22]|uniref:hypothetical protein n=1 Tax=Actinoplanes sp. L3-i22 TaxID=2836373 RepID=UPI001C77B12A|nr:hypothetical protein [Actinoplanes sp. L3-i22]BCY08413.1 hypothetical protein L3i22_035010 [Actinoplanes sp. L3-i22]
MENHLLPQLPLLPDERVLWEGRPRRTRVIRRSDTLLIPFSLVWCGFVIFWESQVLADGAPLFAVLWGVPFILIGIYFVAGRFLVRGVAIKRTRYTITNRRLLVHGGWTGTRVTTEYLRILPPPVITERPDGSGDLAFGAFPALTEPFVGARRMVWRTWAAEPSFTPILWDISDVRRVRDFVAHAQSQPG